MQWAELQPLLRHFSLSDQRKIEQAFRLGAQLHAGQVRQSGEPYFSHPTAVAAILTSMDADRDTLIAALLHDTVEDTPITLREIDEAFDGTVASLIEGVTKLFATELAEKPGLNEQIESLRKMFTLMEKDVRIMVIKLVDRLHNMRTAEFLSPERRRALAQETSDVYVKIADRLCLQDLRYELEELCLSILQPSLFEQLVRLRDESQRRSPQILELMREHLRKTHGQLLHRITTHYEPKAWNKLRAQLEAKGTVITGLSSITVTFVCRDRDTCYQVLGALHTGWRQEELSFRDYINAPVESGYQGLHTTVILADGTRVRCKIRTEEMEEYFHRGVCTFCFKPAAREAVAALLPWTRHLPSLTQETRNRSVDFWQSLQSDILGETITIHGPNDETAQLPKGSTALDGAFYLFREKTLSLHSLRVNGQGVVFGSVLANGVSLDPSFSEELTVKREWLQRVQTRYSISLIRSAIVEETEEARELVGKEILQRILTERKRGFLEEFNVEEVDERLRPLGLESLRDACIAIADGRVEPIEVHDAMFRPDAGKNEERTEAATVRYRMNLQNTDVMDRIIRVHRKFSKGIREIRYVQPGSQQGMAHLRTVLPPKRLRELMDELAASGAKEVGLTERPSALRFTMGMFLLIFLWGLDPVFGRTLLTRFPVEAIDMVIVRFWSLTAMSFVFLLWTRRKNMLREAVLPLRNVSLWVSVALLLCVSFFTYAALETTQPTHYTIPMTVAGLILMSVAHRHKGALIATWIALVLGIALLIARTPGWPALGIVSTLLAVGSFSAFSIVSERYKRQNRVEARAAQYFFVLSALCALPATALLPFSNLGSLDFVTIILMAAFSVVIAGLPYYLYYLLLTHREIDFVLRYSYLLIPVTIAGQYFFGEPISSITWVAAGLVLTGAVLPSFFSAHHAMRLQRARENDTQYHVPPSLASGSR